MKPVLCLAAFAALAWSLPADAQPRTRDHRSSDTEVKEERERERVPARRGGRAVEEERKAEEDRRDRRDRRGERRSRRGDRRDRGPVVSGYAPERGPAGTEITIRGRHFDDDTRVYVDGRRVRDASVARSRITFELPDRASGEPVITLRQRGSRDDIVVGNFEVRERRARADRERRRAERERRARQRWEDRRRGLPEKAEDRRRRLKEEEEKLSRTRAERRRARAAKMRAQWEREFLAHPQVRVELSLHAERRARLERMLRLAEVDAHDRLVVRIEVLIERETERHERRMDTLRRQLR